MCIALEAFVLELRGNLRAGFGRIVEGGRGGVGGLNM